jgi:hypothetical protein
MVEPGKRVVGQSPGSNHDGFAEASWLTPRIPLRAVKIELQALKCRAWEAHRTTHPGSNHDVPGGTSWLTPSVSRSPPLWATLYQITLPKSGDGDVEITGLFDVVLVSQ